MKSGF